MIEVTKDAFLRCVTWTGHFLITSKNSQTFHLMNHSEKFAEIVDGRYYLLKRFVCYERDTA